MDAGCRYVAGTLPLGPLRCCESVHHAPPNRRPALETEFQVFGDLMLQRCLIFMEEISFDGIAPVTLPAKDYAKALSDAKNSPISRFAR